MVAWSSEKRLTAGLNDAKNLFITPLPIHGSTGAARGRRQLVPDRAARGAGREEPASAPEARAAHRDRRVLQAFVFPTGTVAGRGAQSVQVRIPMVGRGDAERAAGHGAR